MGQTSIEWCDKVWNPVTGCTPVSAGCDHCYAARMAKRLAGRCGYPKDDPFKVTFHEERINEMLLHVKKPSRIFVNSMGDLFHPDVCDDDLINIFTAMFCCEKHQFLILTKRPERMKNFVSKFSHYIWPMKHIWLGVTAENQETADERIPLLLQTPAAVRFVSVEPMLGPVYLRPYLLNLKCDHFAENPTEQEAREGVIDCYRSENASGKCTPYYCPFGGYAKLDWVICGGETGPGARPMHPDWVRSLRDQCQEAWVPFFFKQWGGKKSNGRTINGYEWNEFPEVK